mmetsp:Transcript_15510/g.39277  ORF Transcript_15510/g.39277 Transcript_15510/m.39277 type:complete len:123 (-) Transcript_15510:499-867(-)
MALLPMLHPRRCNRVTTAIASVMRCACTFMPGLPVFHPPTMLTLTLTCIYATHTLLHLVLHKHILQVEGAPRVCFTLFSLTLFCLCLYLTLSHTSHLPVPSFNSVERCTCQLVFTVFTTSHL